MNCTRGSWRCHGMPVFIQYEMSFRRVDDAVSKWKLLLGHWEKCRSWRPQFWRRRLAFGRQFCAWQTQSPTCSKSLAIVTARKIALMYTSVWNYRAGRFAASPLSIPAATSIDFTCFSLSQRTIPRSQICIYKWFVSTALLESKWLVSHCLSVINGYLLPFYCVGHARAMRWP